MKKKVFSLAMVICCLSIIVGSTTAYLKTKTVTDNAITTGKIDITLSNREQPMGLNRESDTDMAVVSLGTLVPGDIFYDVFAVKNEDDSATAFIRVKVDVVLEGKDSKDFEIFEEESNDFWTYKDGWYYYNEAVEAGEYTESVFDAVNVVVDIDNSLAGVPGSVEVIAQAVQRANNGENPLEAQGWPAIG